MKLVSQCPVKVCLRFEVLYETGIISCFVARPNGGDVCWCSVPDAVMACPVWNKGGDSRDVRQVVSKYFSIKINKFESFDSETVQMTFIPLSVKYLNGNLNLLQLYCMSIQLV